MALPRRPWKLLTRARPILFALLVLLAAELFAEGHSRETRGLYREDPLLFWALNAGCSNYAEESRSVLQVNSQGLRGPEIPPREAGPRLLLLGDSSTYGFGLPDPLAPDRTLEAELRRRTGKDWHCCNGGIPGYSSSQGVHLMEEIAPRIQAEAVVIGYLYADRARERMPDHERYPESLAWLRSALWKSSLYRALRSAILGKPADGSVRPEDMFNGGDQTRVPLERQARNLRLLARLARENGARSVVFLLLPNLSPDRGEGCPHAENFKRVGAQEGCVVDLMEAWKREGCLDGRLFLPGHNLHLNEEGSQKLGADLAEALVECGAVAPKSR